MLIRELRADHYRIPLPLALSDSTHGTIRGFELITARVRDADGAEGAGYTYTVGAGGAAILALLTRELAPLLAGHEAECIEDIWQTMWWALHYGGRGGAQVLAMSAVDIALWDLRARRQGAPLWRVLGGFDPGVPCYAGGIDLDFPLAALLRQTDENQKRGFRAIKMKVGRPSLREDVERVRAMRAHLGPDFPLMVDANMRWSVDEAIRAARARPHRRRRRRLPRARRHQLRRRDDVHEDLSSRRGVQPAGDIARRPRPHRPPPGGRAQSFPTSKPTASASTASSPSPCVSRPAWRSRRTGPATGSSSTGKRST